MRRSRKYQWRGGGANVEFLVPSSESLPPELPPDRIHRLGEPAVAFALERGPSVLEERELVGIAFVAQPR